MKLTLKIAVLICVFFLVSCGKTKFKEKWTHETAPKTFKAVFETTQGSFTIKAERNWSPKGVDRLYQLIKYDFYKDVAFYRVVPNYVVQFGIQNDTLLNYYWTKHKVKDEPVLQKNDSLTIAFARDFKDTRNTHLFINLKNNNKLDTVLANGVKGFPVIGKVIDGGEVVHKLYGGYENSVFDVYDTILKKGNSFLRKEFPKLDYIKRAYLLN